MAKATVIGGFQVSTVDEVPEAIAAARGIYAELIEAVPTAPKALSVDFEDAKKAATRVAGLRGYLKRHNRVEEFVVVRQKSVVFISRSATPKDAQSNAPGK